MGLFSDNSRVSVIESRLETHEKYFAKLDESIEKLSDVSLGIKEMLIKHEGKLEERVNEDTYLNEKIESLKNQNKEDHESLETSVQTLSKKVSDLTKWRYFVAGGIAIVGFLVGILSHNIEVFNTNIEVSPQEIVK
jgi:hypothetical protein